jgi:hypothetical protein
MISLSKVNRSDSIFYGKFVDSDVAGCTMTDTLSSRISGVKNQVGLGLYLNEFQEVEILNTVSVSVSVTYCNMAILRRKESKIEGNFIRKFDNGTDNWSNLFFFYHVLVSVCLSVVNVFNESVGFHKNWYKNMATQSSYF